MNKTVLISVQGKQVNEYGEADVQELVTTGSYHCKNGTYFIVYAESEITGMLGTTTSVKAEPDRVTVNRMGTSELLQIFENGVRWRSNYITPYGVIDMAVVPSEVEVNLTDAGGSINLKYVLEVQNEKISDNALSLTVREA